MVELKSLITELPKIIERGKKEAERILDGLSKKNKVTLQTNELVLPTKSKGGLFSFTGQAVKGDVKKEWINRMIYGDNLLAMQALLAGDPQSKMPSMRGKIDLIYIDPPFDSKADYRTKIHLPSIDIEAMPTVIEQHAYSDTWKDGTVSYLEMMVPRLILMRELLSEQGSVYVHIDWHVGHYVKVILDEIFGKDCFLNEIIWKKLATPKAQTTGFGNIHDTLFVYKKGSKSFFNEIKVEHADEYLNQMYRHVEEDGRRYRLSDFTQKGQGEARRFGNKVLEPPRSKHWIWSQEKIDEAMKIGLIVFSKNGIPSVKRYLEEVGGRVLCLYHKLGSQRGCADAEAVLDYQVASAVGGRRATKR